MNREELKTEAKGIIKNRLWEYWKPILIYLLISMVIEMVLIQFIPLPTNLETYEISPNEVILNLILNILTLPLVMGVNKYHLDYVRRKELNLNCLKSYFSKIVPLLGLYLATSILTALGTICLIIPGIIISLALYFAYYVYIDDEKGVIETLKDSAALMQGHKWELFVLIFSFLGWAILGVLTFGILYIWLAPYMTTTLLLYYDKLKKAK